MRSSSTVPVNKFIGADAFAANESAVEPRLLKAEAENFRRAEAALAAWRKEPPAPHQVACLQDEFAERTLADIKAIAPRAAGK